MLGHQFRLAAHGYSPLYFLGEVNHCPGCGRSQWLIGRVTAECAFCATALPLEHTGFEGSSLGVIYWNRDLFRHGWHVGHADHESKLVGVWEP